MNIRKGLARGRDLARRIYGHYRGPAPANNEEPVNQTDRGPAPVNQTDRQAKVERLRRVAAYLICPHCRGELDETKSRCKQCDRSYAHTDTHYNFLTTEFQNEFEIVATDNVAANEYDHIATPIIAEHPDGLILDCGSGRHVKGYPNVIYYEVAGYPSTDVLGVGESLPFRDETFDAIFSLNVLEHVADPFRCAAEITRVLKGSGTLYCVVPFLAPLHSYPNHYYNMTSQGLCHLFERNFEIVEHKVAASGLPVWCLNWMLRSWSDGLDGKTKQEFLNMTVRELTELEPLGYLERDFVTELSTEKNFELATTTMLIGKKSQA